MEHNQTYAIVLSKNSQIVQIRNFNTTADNAISHAKEFSQSGSAWFDRVALYRTVDHIKDLLNDGEEFYDDDANIMPPM